MPNTKPVTLEGVTLYGLNGEHLRSYQVLEFWPHLDGLKSTGTLLILTEQAKSAGIEVASLPLICALLDRADAKEVLKYLLRANSIITSTTGNDNGNLITHGYGTNNPLVYPITLPRSLWRGQDRPKGAKCNCNSLENLVRYPDWRAVLQVLFASHNLEYALSLVNSLGREAKVWGFPPRKQNRQGVVRLGYSDDGSLRIYCNGSLGNSEGTYIPVRAR